MNSDQLKQNGNLLEGCLMSPELKEWLETPSRKWMAFRVVPGNQGATWKKPRDTRNRKA